MFAKTENTADASETRGAEEIDGCINWMSSELIEERIRANIESLNLQHSLSCVINQSKTTRRKLPQRRVRVPITRRRDPRLIGRPESLEPRPTWLLEVRDSRPTFD